MQAFHGFGSIARALYVSCSTQPGPNSNMSGVTLIVHQAQGLIRHGAGWYPTGRPRGAWHTVRRQHIKSAKAKEWALLDPRPPGIVLSFNNSKLIMHCS